MREVNIYDLIDHVANKAGVTSVELTTSRSHEMCKLRAMAYHVLATNGWEQRQIGHKMGYSQGTVSKALRVLHRSSTPKELEGRFRKLGLTSFYVPAPPKAESTQPGVPEHVLKKCLKRVERLTGVAASVILSMDKRRRSVTARMALTMVLYGEGFSSGAISRATGRSLWTIYHHQKVYLSGKYPEAIRIVELTQKYNRGPGAGFAPSRK